MKRSAAPPGGSTGRAGFRSAQYAHPIAALHRRAAAWLEGNALLDEAVPHNLAAREYEKAATLIETIAEKVMKVGRRGGRSQEGRQKCR